LAWYQRLEVRLLREEAEALIVREGKKRRGAIRAVVQKEFLESGRMGYPCVDTVGEAGNTGRGCDCIHAITDMDPDYSRSRYRLIRFGIAASRFIANELGRRDMLLDPNKTQDWLNRRLGLDAYRITQWRLTSP
jgi:hypothetical protein